MAILLANNAKSTLAVALGGIDTTLVVASGTETLFPSPTGGDYFYATLEDSTKTIREIVKCTARSGTSLTIIRAQDDSTANIFAVGSTVEMRVNKGALADSVGLASASAASAAASAASATTSANTATTGANTATTQAGIATTQATNASNSATAANNSAIAAAASAASGMYSAVQDKSANYTVVAGDAGDLIRVTTTSGAITITLPTIASVGDGFKIAIVKWTADGNPVNVNRSGSDTINGGVTSQIGSQYSQIILVADLETSQWFASQSGLGATNVNVDVFSGTGSQTAFTLSADPSTKNNTYVSISGVYQAKATYSVSGTTLTFSTAPPTGTSNIEVVYGTPLAIGTPSDGTVSTDKLTDGALAATTAGRLKMADLYVTTAKLADDAVTTVKIANANVTPAKLSQPLTLGTAVASTSGTAIDFTSIPSWVKRITVMLSGVSTSGTSNILFQLGDSGGVETSGYLGSGSVIGASSASSANFTTGFGITGAVATYDYSGNLMICLQDGATNNWTANGFFGSSTLTATWLTSGKKSLSATLDRVRITTANGTDTFDAGSINILYE